MNFIHKIEIRERKIAFLRIPSHCDISGNEKVDRVARSAARDKQTSTTKVTLQEANYHVLNEIRSKWKEVYTN